jgi:hypothetical protein
VNRLDLPKGTSSTATCLAVEGIAVRHRQLKPLSALSKPVKTSLSSPGNTEGG